MNDERETTRQTLDTAAEMLESAATQMNEMIAVLSQYANNYCEGWCKDSPAKAIFEDCGGCPARCVLANNSAHRGTEA